MKAQIEKPTTQEVKGVIENAAAMPTLEGAYRYLLSNLAGWFIYRGGSHIAICRKSGIDRTAIITA